MLNKTNKNLVLATLILLHFVMGIDVSSNFLLDKPPIILPITRDLLLITLFFFSARYFFINQNRFFLVFIFVLLSLLIGLIYGFIYTHYLTRLMAVAIFFSVFFNETRKTILVLSVMTIFYLAGIYVLFADSLYVNQGSRFFAANATVVSLLSIYLTYAYSNNFKLIGYASGFLTGSMSFFLYALIRAFQNPRLMIFIGAVFITIKQLIISSDSFLRIEKFSNAISTLSLVNLVEISTLGARIDQLNEILDSRQFSIFFGASLNLTPSDAGIESQFFHALAYGGLLGIIAFLFSLFVLALLSRRLRSISIIFWVIILLYSIAFRWLESFFSVYYIVLIAFQMFALKNNHSVKKSINYVHI